MRRFLRLLGTIVALSLPLLAILLDQQLALSSDPRMLILVFLMFGFMLGVVWRSWWPFVGMLILGAAYSGFVVVAPFGTGQSSPLLNVLFAGIFAVLPALLGTTVGRAVGKLVAGQATRAPVSGILVPVLTGLIVGATMADPTDIAVEEALVFWAGVFVMGVIVGLLLGVWSAVAIAPTVYIGGAWIGSEISGDLTGVSALGEIAYLLVGLGPAAAGVIVGILVRKRDKNERQHPVAG